MAKLWFMGEALVDFVPVAAPDGGRAYAPRCGGSPFNTAKAAAAAGARVGFLGAFSTDMFGAMLADDLARHGIDLSAAPRLDAPTTLAFVDFEGGEPRYAFFNEGTATRRIAPDSMGFDPAPDDLVGFGSISLIDQPGADAIAAFAEAIAGRARIAIDPNARPVMTRDPADWRRRVGRILAVADVVRLSIEDLAFLDPGAAPEDFARRLIAGGAGLVVVTHGADGAEGWSRAAHARVPAPRVAVVDTVGAGDTLMGTLLATLAGAGWTAPGALGSLSEAALRAALMRAVAAAALNCTASGCAPPSRAMVDTFLNDHPAPG
jgi:fructokinase